MIEPPVQDIVRRIVEAFAPRRVVLFGSRARGTARPDSDVDLMIEMETPLSPADRALSILRLFGLRSWAMDVIVFTPYEIAAQRHSPTSLVRAIESEGKVLYERP